jgi:hypothetical protein
MSATPDDRAKEIEQTREFIRRILTGEISPATRPGLFVEGDDVLFHALAFLELNDRAWLEAQLADEAYPQAARDLVRQCRPQPLFAE